MKFKRLNTLLAATAMGLLLSTNSASAQHGQYVGGDISDLPLYEEHNSGYLDGNGKKIDNLLSWFKNECGWNSFRVRLFVNPKQLSNDGKTVDKTVCQDIEYVKALGKRIKAAGAYFMLDIHYSDTYVDATHIQAPSACSGMTADQKAAWIYNYTKESLEALQSVGATPDLVQVGNEIMYGFMGIAVAPYDKSGTDWTGYLKVLKQGCQAVRDVCPKAKIIIHTDRPTNAQYNKYYYGKLDDAGIPYDVIGLSYYPFWHGTLANLKTALTNLKSEFSSKEVQIVETAYNFQYWPSSGVNYDTRSTWPCSVDGQYAFVKDLVAGLSSHENVDGLFYWCPEEAGNGDDTTDWSTGKKTVMESWLNRGMWYLDLTTTGHWPLKASEGMVHYLLKNFLDPTSSSINQMSVTDQPSVLDNRIYSVSGQYIGNDINKVSAEGLYITNGKKIIIR